MSHLIELCNTWMAELSASLSNMDLAVAAPLAVFAVTALAVWVVAGRLMRRDPVEERLHKAAGERGATPPNETGLFGAWTPALAAQIPESAKERDDFRKLLRSAGVYSPHALATIYALRFVLLVTPLVVTGILAVAADGRYTIQILIGGGIVAAASSILPRLYVFLRRRRRLAKIRRGLSDAIDMLGMCVGSGLTVGQSLEHVANQLTSHPELAMELAILKRQIDVSSLERGLADFRARVDLPEVRQLSALLTRSDRLGTRLVGSLLGQSDQIRVARRQQAMLRANKAPVKLVLPLMFCFAPAAAILLTAPAVLELKEFLAPSQGQSAISGSAGEGIGAAQIIDTLNGLDQQVDP